MSGLQGHVEVTYKELVRTFGEPNSETDEYKTDAKWEVQTPHGKAYIYNYKDGKHYRGNEGKDVKDITDWHIGGNNTATAEYIRGELS